MMEVGVDELKTKLSAYLNKVKAGETVVVTERGKPIAELVSGAETPIPPELAPLVASGRLRRPTRRLSPREPLPIVPGDKTLARMISEDRNRDWVRE